MSRNVFLASLEPTSLQLAASPASSAHQVVPPFLDPIYAAVLAKTVSFSPRMDGASANLATNLLTTT